ncbi:MAG: hypothetical protein HY262_03270 [Chloroflexi bacterium]|nr:hypothetical protein [Chloroflexota bacterium]
MLADVAARTEGWAASLQLVQAALRDRSAADIRRFVRGLSGADQELYDYLAEEVVGDLPEDVQKFLMRTSILEGVTPELAAVVTGMNVADVARLTGVAERLTLLSRQSRTSRGPQRYHPLVREFLEARLRATTGAAAVTQLHRTVADTTAGTNWRTAAHHYREAGDLHAVAAVVADAIPEIMGSGQYAVAIGFVEHVSEGDSAGLNLVRSRVAMQRGDRDRAIALSSAVLQDAGPGSNESDHALLNLSTMYMHAGDPAQATGHLDRLRSTSRDEHLRLIAEGMAMMIEASAKGSLEQLTRRLEDLAERQRGIHQHYLGVTMVNLAFISILRDDPGRALECTAEAIEALAETSSRIELSTAIMTRATAHMMVGRVEEAALEATRASAYAQTEAALERADLTDSYGSPEDAEGLLAAIESRGDLNLNDRFSLSLQLARHLSRRGRFEEARARIPQVDPAQYGGYAGQMIAALGTSAYVAVAARSSDADAIAQNARHMAGLQGAEQWRRIAELLCASNWPDDQFAGVVKSVGTSSPWNVTFVADLIGRRLDDLDDAAYETVVAAARLHPGRWRFVLRQLVTDPATTGPLNAARLLEAIGERPDIRRLRSYARSHRKLPGASALGRTLARRLADRVFVEDLHRVTIRIGDRQISGSAVRRKVLALLCFLLTKPELAATRDQVLDALWPDLDPVDAVNSLNQTVYFLRRILEEDYVDDLSPGYLHHDSDLIWLDPELLTSRSNECRRLIKSFPQVPTPDQVAEILRLYTGRFAMDFEYEEWATPHRDWLHASFLEIVERAVLSDIETGHFDRGIRGARQVLDIDPSAEQVEVSLLRLYRASGAHAAAAEQYGHYAAVMRDQLGVEPPPLESL